MTQRHTYEKGVIDGWMISTIGLIILVIVAGTLAVTSHINYQKEKENVQTRIDRAVSDAKKEQADEDEKKFAEREKEPRTAFVGPEDYGRLTFNYPKTWSAYVDRDGANRRDFNAYLHPGVVPPIGVKDNLFALRVEIVAKNYDEYVEDFDKLVKDGKLRSSTFTAFGESGVRFDGMFSDKVRGSMVVFKIRDRTAVIRTDADTFKPDFEEIVQTIQFQR